MKYSFNWAVIALLFVAALVMSSCGGSATTPTPVAKGQLVAPDKLPAGIGRGYAMGRVDAGTGSSAPLVKGQAAPNFDLALDAGQYTDLASFAGRPVVINFWATWCGPCQEEMPQLVKAAADNPDLAVIAVNVQETRSQVEPFAQKFGMDLPIVLDDVGRVRELYQVKGFPTTYFVDRNGKIAATFAGPLTPKALADRLAEIQ